MPPTIHIDPATIDMSRIIADRAAIRRVNPQRFEMEQLTAIVYIDPSKRLLPTRMSVLMSSASTCPATLDARRARRAKPPRKCARIT